MFEGFHKAEFAGMTEDGLAIFREAGPAPATNADNRPYAGIAAEDTKARAKVLLAALMAPDAW